MHKYLAFTLFKVCNPINIIVYTSVMAASNLRAIEAEEEVIFCQNRRLMLVDFKVCFR
jgi:hypothetical protein